MATTEREVKIVREWIKQEMGAKHVSDELIKKIIEYGHEIARRDEEC